MEIYVVDRASGKKVKEQILGHGLLKWCYNSRVGRSLTKFLLKRRFLSIFYGWFMDRGFSRRFIKKFIEDFQIDTAGLEKPVSDYRTFNQFFYRKIKDEHLHVITDRSVAVCCAEARLSVYTEIDIENLLQIKGITYRLSSLIPNTKFIEKYQGGSYCIFRLAPVDYHRYIFCDDGVPIDRGKFNGNLYSVNPLALKRVANLFCQNKREYTLFRSRMFGDILFVDIGATNVGSIINTYSLFERVKKGDERGYFKFGGSTILMFLEKNRIRFDDDLIQNTQKGLETKVKLGSSLGKTF